MATSDSKIVFSQIDETSIVASDYNGVHSHTLDVVKGTLSWKTSKLPSTEMRVRDQHTTTKPTIRKTGSANVTGSLTIHISSFYGAADETPYEVFNNRAGWTPTAYGDAPTMKLLVTRNASGVNGGGATGASQTIAFNFLEVQSCDIKDEDGILALTMEFVDYEDYPTIA